MSVAELAVGILFFLYLFGRLGVWLADGRIYAGYVLAKEGGDGLGIQLSRHVDG